MRNISILKQALLGFLKSADTYIGNHIEVLFIIISIIFIFIVCTWVIFERLGIRGWKSLIPIYNNYVVFRAVGMRPFLSFFLIIPFTNIPIFVSFVFHLLKSFKRSYFFAIGLLLLPVVFLPILAFGEGHYEHLARRHARLSDNPLEDEKLSRKQRKIKAKRIKQRVKTAKKLKNKKQNQFQDKQIYQKPVAKEQVPLPIMTKTRRPIVTAKPFRDIVATPKPASQVNRSTANYARLTNSSNRQNLQKRPTSASPRPGKRAMEFMSVPKNRKNLAQNNNSKKIVSTGVSIDMVKRTPKKKI